MQPPIVEVAATSAPPEQLVDHTTRARARHRLKVELIKQVLRCTPQALPSAQIKRGNSDMHSVNKIRLDELAKRRHPSTEANIFAIGSSPSLLQSLSRSRIDEMKGRISQSQAWARMVCQHKHRRMKRRSVTPPTLPLKVLPRASQWAELVATHDLSANVLFEVASEVVIQPTRSTRLRTVRPARSGSRPRKQLTRIAMTKGPLQGLTLPRTEPIPGNSEVLNSQQLCHQVDPMAVMVTKVSL